MSKARLHARKSALRYAPAIILAIVVVGIAARVDGRVAEIPSSRG